LAHSSRAILSPESGAHSTPPKGSCYSFNRPAIK
jgi:hypothetical protein